MHKLYVFFSLIWGLPGLAIQAQNLVPNPQFDQFEFCPFRRGQIELAPPWYSPNTKTTDFVHTCATPGATGVPENNWGWEIPFKGEGYAGIRTWLDRSEFNTPGNYREYLATPLLDSLRKGKTYYVGFKVSVGDSALYTSDDIGLAFSDTLPPLLDVLPLTPAIANPQGEIIFVSSGWYPIEGNYTANGGEQHLVIGNFLDDDETTLRQRNFSPGPVSTTYFFIDHVQVIPCDSLFDGPMVLPVDSLICPGEGRDLIVREVLGVSSQWENGSTDLVRNVSLPQQYILTSEIKGCVQQDTVTLTASPAPSIDLGNDTTLCPGEGVWLQVPDTLATYQWNDLSSASSLWVTETGLYTLTASLGDCQETDSIRIEVEIPPLLRPLLDTAICEGSPLLLSPSVEGYTFSWQDQTRSNSLTVTRAGTYWVDIEGSCFRERETFEVRAEDCNCGGMFPNVFTPNQDGINDFFHPQLAVGISDYQLKIYDRWGQQYFQSQHPEDLWDGLWQGHQAPEGVYFWALEYTCLEQGEFIRKRQKGSLSLLR